MKITTIGIDLAKEVFQMHGVNESGKAICEAVSRPNMRFVPIKNVEQQAILSVHRARKGFVKARTAQALTLVWQSFLPALTTP